MEVMVRRIIYNDSMDKYRKSTHSKCQTAQARSILLRTITIVSPDVAGTGIRSNMLDNFANDKTSGVSVYEDTNSNGAFELGVDLFLGVGSFTWTSVITALYSIDWPVDANTCYAGGENGKIIKTTDGGSNCATVFS
jgi:hypothetical protein